jgi:signal peptidase II
MQNQTTSIIKRLKYNLKTMAVLIPYVIVFVIFDRYLKFVAMYSLQENKEFIGGIAEFTFIKNKSLAFSIPLFNNGTISVLTFLVLVGLSYVIVFKSRRLSKMRLFCLLLIFAGAISNLYDRVAFGYVVDYLSIAYFSVLNIADILITSGVFVLIVMAYKESPLKTAKA